MTGPAPAAEPETHADGVARAQPGSASAERPSVDRAQDVSRAGANQVRLGSAPSPAHEPRPNPTRKESAVAHPSAGAKDDPSARKLAAPAAPTRTPDPPQPARPAAPASGDAAPKEQPRKKTATELLGF